MSKENTIPLEILVATMNRNSLDFLDTMFANDDLNEHHILVINQTTEDSQLESNSPRIRVINSVETGLSRSRNLAIQHAQGTICLLTDDDVVFIKDFGQTILSAYKSIPTADLLCFQTLTHQGQPFSRYPKKRVNLNSFYSKVLSIEITFKRYSMIDNDLSFDALFGLGSVFEDGENRLFLKSVLDHPSLTAYFIPEFIVQHGSTTSSDDVSSDRFIHARSALNYKQHGNFVYFYIFKLLFSLLRKGYIKPREVWSKFQVALNGISKFKTLNNA